MIKDISVEKLDKNKYTPTVIRDKNKKNPTFTGLGSLAVTAMQCCEREPMLNVTVLDLLTAIGPRTIAETVTASKVTDENGNPVLDENGKQKRRFNFLAGFEALRRESSGLFINCILPGVFVIGAAGLLNNPIMGSKSNLIKNWSNKDTLNVIKDYYKGTGADNYAEMLKNIFVDLKGADGKEIDKSLAQIYEADSEEFNRIFSNMAKLADSEKYDKKALNKAIDNIIKKTGISENIKFTKNNPKNSYFSDSLESLFRNTVEILHDAQKAGIDSAEGFSAYIKKAQKLVKWKSIGGMSIVIPLAISAQPINRWITHKTSGKKGAPIYNDDEEIVIKSNDRPNMANFDRSSFPSSRRSNSEKTEDNTIEEKVEENNND